MRYVLAIAALVLSGVLLLLGIGQRTFLAGPAEIRYEVAVDTDAGFAVISGEELALVPGQANVVLSGENTFVATGSTNDVSAWVAPVDHIELFAEKSDQSFSVSKVAAVDTNPADESDGTDGSEADDAAASGTDQASFNPRGSDLWLKESTADKSSDSKVLRAPVNADAQQSVLITGDKEKLPASIAVVWVQDRSTPWAGPLLVGGGVLALVGAVLYVLAIDHDRRGLGPRRGRKGPLQGIRNSFSRKNVGSSEPSARTPQEDTAKESSQTSAKGTEMSSRANRARKFVLPAVGLSLALGLSGCSASYWPQFDEAASETEAAEEQPSSSAPLPVTPEQLDRILTGVVKASDQADEDLDPELLKKRFVGDALAQRTANYAIRGAVPEWPAPPLLTTDELDYQLVQSTESWPRTMLVTVASTKAAPAEGDNAEGEDEKADASPSLALVLSQQTPHENYQVSSVISLRGGIAMPQAAPAEEGTALLANDIESFLLPPGEVGAAFASVLQEGEASEQFDLFEFGDDNILETAGKARVERLAAEAEEKGTPMVYSVAARQGDEPAVALTTGVGGALVVTTVLEEQIVDGAGGRIKPVATGQVTALSGLSGQQEQIVQVFSHQMLFFVPSKTDEGAKIQLLGDTRELIGARS